MTVPKPLLQTGALATDELREALRTLSFQVDPSLALEHPTLRAALDVWTVARGSRPMPARVDIDPLRMPREILPHILLIEVEHAPRQRFRWRLIGTHITGTLGRDSTGRYLDELYEPEAEACLLTGPRWAMEHRRPVRTLGSASLRDEPFLQLECIHMPLSDDGACVSMILTASVYDRSVYDR